MRKRVRLLREEVVPIDGMPVRILHKNIKNLYLRVRPPEGIVEASAPRHMSRVEIEDFVRRRHAWIEQRQRLIRAQAERCAPQYAEGEIISLWGRAYPIMIAPLPFGKAYAERMETHIVLHMRTNADAEIRRRAVDALYRTELMAAIERITPSCEKTVGKRASLWRIRAMRTRWGSCNVRTAAITLNLHLARYDERALRYVILHELTHLWVRGHDARFYARMDTYFPDWQVMRRTLNAWARDNNL